MSGSHRVVESCADQQAAEAIYRQHFSSIYRYVRRRVGDNGLAADIAQDVFVDLLTALPRLDASRPILPWLYVVARRRTIDALARARRVLPCDRVEEGEEHAVDPGSSVFALLAALPPIEREIVYRRALLEQPFDAIARSIDSNAGACRMRYARALATLRTISAALLPVLPALAPIW